MRIKIFLAIIALVGIGILVNTVFYQALKDAAVRTAGVPIKAMTGVVFSVRNFFGSFELLADQRKQALELQENVKQLAAKNAQLETVEDENERLRALLELKRSLNYQNITAEVVSREPFGLSRSIILDKGANDGVEKGDPVVDGSGNLIGLINTVYNNSSSMIKLTDSSSQVDVFIPEKNVLGIVVGAHGVGLQMELVSQEVSIDRGSMVVTAGLNPLVPAGIMVGIVDEIAFEGSDLFKQISIKPAADMRGFKQVIVITNSRD